MRHSAVLAAPDGSIPTWSRSWIRSFSILFRCMSQWLVRSPDFVFQHVSASTGQVSSRKPDARPCSSGAISSTSHRSIHGCGPRSCLREKPGRALGMDRLDPARSRAHLSKATVEEQDATSTPEAGAFSRNFARHSTALHRCIRRARIDACVIYTIVIGCSFMEKGWFTSIMSVDVNVVRYACVPAVVAWPRRIHSIRDAVLASLSRRHPEYCKSSGSIRL